ncbi:MAG: hypothetical protein JF570_10140 [Caulobacter sp.]|nr:hypothetical protein [Caulobacter sp.]
MKLRLFRSIACLLVLAGGGLAACSRSEHKTAAPETTAPAAIPPPVAGGPSTLKPGLWKTVTRTPAGDEVSTQCVGEGYDPGAEAAAKASPCGRPTLTRTASGFRLDHACEKDGVTYALTGVVRGDFTTTATTVLDLDLSAFGRHQALHLQAVSTYQGPCPAGGESSPKP